MYEIRKDGGVIALTEKPNYIRRHADGFYILCEEEDAQGVAVDGTVYRLMGHTGLDELKEVQLIEKDTGAVLQSSSEAVGIAFVTMTERGDIDGVTAGEHAELFSPWAYPVAYTAGQIRERSGKLYKCLQAHTSQADWKPEDSPSLWVGTSNPAEEWPEWSQPVGSTDAYAKGAKVSHNGKHWTSDVDANVWEPGAYGWTEATA